MITADDVREIALSLPGAYEAPHFHMASFRVGKKIFCTIHTDLPRMMLKLDPEDQHNLAEAGIIEPVPGAWGRQGSTFIWYQKLAPERLAPLLRLAWATVAPKGILKAQAPG